MQTYRGTHASERTYTNAHCCNCADARAYQSPRKQMWICICRRSKKVFSETPTRHFRRIQCASQSLWFPSKEPSKNSARQGDSQKKPSENFQESWRRASGEASVYLQGPSRSSAKLCLHTILIRIEQKRPLSNIGSESDQTGKQVT